MNKISTKLVSGLLLLAVFLAGPLGASGLPGLQPATLHIDWTAAAPGVGELIVAEVTKPVYHLLRNDKVTQSSAIMACFERLSAGRDTSYCYDGELNADPVLLDGGYQTYNGAANTNPRVQWTVIQGNGDLGILVNNQFFLAGNNTVTNENFAYSGNGGTSSGFGEVYYRPAPGDDEVILRISPITSDGSCIDQPLEVNLFFDPFQPTEINVTAAGNSAGQADVDARGTVSICSGENFSLTLANLLVEGQQFGAPVVVSYAASLPTSLTLGNAGSSVNGSGSTVDFNNNFAPQSITNNTSSPQSFTLEVVTFYDRLTGAEACVSETTFIDFTVQPAAQATSGIVGNNPNICAGEIAQISITGSPNSTVTYAIDFGSGYGAEQTTVLPALGGTTVDVDTDLLVSGSRIRFQLREVRFNSGAPCPAILSETETITVVPGPEGTLTLTPMADTTFYCNADLPAAVLVDFATTSAPGTYRFFYSVDSSGTTVATDSFDLSSASASVSVDLPGSSATGNTISINLDSIRGIGTPAICTATMLNSSIEIVEETDFELSVNVTPRNTNVTTTVANDGGAAPTFIVCDEVGIEIELDAFTNSVAPFNAEQMLLVTVVGDTFNAFGFGADSVTVLIDAADFAPLATGDIPNNAMTQSILFRIRPVVDYPNSSAEGCFGSALEFNVIIERNPTVRIIAEEKDVCEGDQATFTISATQPGTANLVLGNGGSTITVPVVNQEIVNNGMDTVYRTMFTSIPVTQDTSYTLTTFATGSGTCVRIVNDRIDLNVQERPMATITTDDSFFCADSQDEFEFVLTGSGGLGGEYTFVGNITVNGNPFQPFLRISDNGTDTVTFQNPVSTFGAPAIVEVELTSVRNLGGLFCETTLSETITIVIEEQPAVVLTGSFFGAADLIELDTENGPLMDNDTICSGDSLTIALATSGNFVSPVTGDSLFYAYEIIQDPSGSLPVGQVVVRADTFSGFPTFAINNPFAVPVDIEGQVFAYYGDPSANCNSDTATFELIVNPIPNATFAGNLTVCQGSESLLEFTGPNNGSVTVTVVEGFAPAFDMDFTGGMGTNAGNMMDSIADDTILIQFSPTGVGQLMTGTLDTTTRFRVGMITGDNTVGETCLNENTFDVVVVVVPEVTASFDTTGVADSTVCAGTSIDFPITADANSAEVYFTLQSSRDTTVRTAMITDSTGVLTTGPIDTATLIVLDSIVTRTLSADGSTVTCVTFPDSTARDSFSVFTLPEVAGTLVAVDTFLCEDDLTMLTFTSPGAASMDSFALTINGLVDTVVSGLAFEPRAMRSTTNDSTLFVLTDILQINGNGCMDTITGPIDTAIVVEEITPVAQIKLTLDGVDTTIVADAASAGFEFETTICGGTAFDFEFSATPDSSFSDLPVGFDLLIMDANGALTGDVMTVATLEELNDGMLSATFNGIADGSNGTSTFTLVAFPTYVTPGATNGQGVCTTGDTIRIQVTVLDELSADFTVNAFNVCEGETATLNFTGDPNIEISFFNGFAGQTVRTNASGNATFVTVPLTMTTVYTITGFSSLPPNQICTRLLTPAEQTNLTVTVIPTPTAQVEIGGADTICINANNMRNANISGTANAEVFYTLGGVDNSIVLNGNGNGQVPLDVSGLSTTELDTLIITLDSISLAGMPVCDALLMSSDTLFTRPIPTGTLTAGDPVCAGDSVAIVFTIDDPEFNPYRIGVLDPMGNRTFYDDVISGDTAFFALLDGDYTLELIRSLAGPNCGNDQRNVTGGIDVVNVVVEEEPRLQADVESEAIVISLANTIGIPTLNATFCEGENLTIDFPASGATPNSDPMGNNYPLFVSVSANDPAGLFTGIFEDGDVIPFTALGVNTDLDNPTGSPVTARIVLTPYFENGDDVDNLNVEECFGRAITLNLTVLPTISATFDLVNSDTVACEDTDINVVITGSPGGLVDFTLTGGTTTANNPVSLNASGTATITIDANTTGDNSVVLSLDTILVTTVNGPIVATCDQVLTDTLFIDVNPLPVAGSLSVIGPDPLCNGSMIDLQFSGFFGSQEGSYTATVNGTDYTLILNTNAGSTITTTGILDINATLTRDSSFVLTQLVNDSTGCVLNLSPFIDSIFVDVEEVPADSFFVENVGAGTTDTLVANDLLSLTVCTGDSIAFDGVAITTANSGSEFVEVAYSGPQDFFNTGMTSGTFTLNVNSLDDLNGRFQNLTDSVETLTIVLTPYFDTNAPSSSRDSDECAGEPTTVIINLNPVPITADQSAVICSDEAFAFDPTDGVTNGTQGATFTYTVMSTNPGVLLPAGRPIGSADSITGTFTNNTNTPIVITYRITPMVGGCEGNDYELAVTVNPEPRLIRVLDEEVCSNEPTGVMLLVRAISNPAGTESFRLNAVTFSDNSVDFIPAPGNVAVGTTSTMVDLLASDTYRNLTAAPVVVSYNVTVISAAGCEGDARIIRVTVQPEPKVVAIVRDTVCSGVRLNVDILADLVRNNVGDMSGITINRRRAASVVNFIVFDGNNNDDEVLFTNGVQNGGPDNEPLIRDSLINATTAGFTLTYDIVVPDSSGCGINSMFQYVVRVVPEGTATLTPAAATTTFCSDETLALVANFNGGSAPANLQYAYQVLAADAGVRLTLTPTTSGTTVRITNNGSTMAGNATIQVMVSDAATGCTATATQVVSIGLTPANMLVGPAEPCAGTPVVYSVANDNSATNTYSWSLSDPSAGTLLSNTGPGVSFDPGSIGATTNIIVVETSPSGCQATFTQAITVVDAPTADFSFTFDANDPFTVNFQEEAEGSIVNYAWDFDGDGNTDVSGQTATNPSFTYPTDGIYNATLTVRSNCDPFNPQTLTVTKQVIIGSTNVCQDFVLQPGLNFVSLTVQPTNNSLDDIFGGITAVTEVRTYIGGQAQSWEPNGGIFNGITTLERGFGYLVFVQGATVNLQICGNAPVDGTQPNPLNGTINLVGTDLTTPVDVEDYFAAILNTSLVSVSSFGNNMQPLFYEPNGGAFNTLETLLPGIGYIVTIDQTINRPSVNGQELVPTEKFEFVYGYATGNAFDSEQPIEVLTMDGLLVGVIHADEDGLFRATAVYGTDLRFNGELTEGAESGQEYVFRHNGVVYEPGVRYEGGMHSKRQDLVFEAALSAESEEVIEYGITVFPNPLSDVAKVSLEVGETGNYSIRVLDVTGRTVRDLLSDTRLGAGTYGYEWNTAQLAVGAYTVVVLRNGELLPELTVRVIK